MLVAAVPVAPQAQRCRAAGYPQLRQAMSARTCGGSNQDRRSQVTSPKSFLLRQAIVHCKLSSVQPAAAIAPAESSPEQRRVIFLRGEKYMEWNGVTGVFHHMGIPTRQAKPGERFSEAFGLHTSDGDCGSVRIQWHRFEPGSPLDPLIQTVPHVAFKVDDLDRAIQGYRLLLGPYEPIPHFRAAIIEDGGHPIELLQTTLTDDEIWGRAIRDGISVPAGNP